MLPPEALYEGKDKKGQIGTDESRSGSPPPFETSPRLAVLELLRQTLHRNLFFGPSSPKRVFRAVTSKKPLTLDGPAIRNANRGDSRESIRRKNLILITFERFARIASNLRFAIFNPPEARFAKKRGSVRES